MVMVLGSGMAALSWEVVWQARASLSLGVSALGTALTLAATMGGMSLGALLFGRWLENRRPAKPLLLYAFLELVIGLAGLYLYPGFSVLESLDTFVWQSSPFLASLVHLAGIFLVIFVPTFAIGATIPIFGLLARRYRTSLSVLYGWNTAGAAIGTMLLALVLVRELGMSLTTQFVAVLNLLAAAAAGLVGIHDRDAEPDEIEGEVKRSLPAKHTWRAAMLIAFTTGFTTFALEVTWFRSMRAAFQSCTDSFAIILTSVLIPLALGAQLVPYIRRRRYTLGPFTLGSAFLVFLATPLIERFDRLVPIWNAFWVDRLAQLLCSLLVLGTPIVLLGTALPLLLDEQRSPLRWGKLYGLNTIGAITGSIIAAWILLPIFGSSGTAWLAGLLLAGTGAAVEQGGTRKVGIGAVAVALFVAVTAQAGPGPDRIQGHFRAHVIEVLDYDETPDSTISVAATRDGERVLVIDGFSAAKEGEFAEYMAWMGRLPMLAHANPERALVICFGTGQTANAVYREGVSALDIVDVNAAVFRMARHFPANEGVLEREGVRHIEMDGRAWLRRTGMLYDVVTLEPMPPFFAGTNALYSQEFYELVSRRLQPGGTVAQWLPFHLVSPYYAASITATFGSVFPNSVLWVDPRNGHGILVGRKDSLGMNETWTWPGFDRPNGNRALSRNQVLDSVWLDAEGVASYGQFGELITDDNQLLAYGWANRNRYLVGSIDRMFDLNFAVLRMTRASLRE